MENLQKDSQATDYNLPGLKYNHTYSHGSKEKKFFKNLILAYLQKTQIKAQETLLEYLCWVTVFCLPFNTSDVIKSCQMISNYKIQTKYVKLHDPEV